MVWNGGRFGSETLLIAGVAMQYVATRLMIAVVGRADGSAPGRTALAQWLPILATTVAAVALGEPGVAIAMIFGSSVAALSLVMGMTTYVMPIGQFPPERRVWPLVLPVAILILLAGFRGSLTPSHAVMLLIMGVVFLAVWREPARSDAITSAGGTWDDRPLGGGLPWVAVALAGLGAWAAMRGMITTGEHSRRLTAELLASTALSPLLLLPAIGVGTMVAQKGHADRVVTALCGTVLLNLCVLLPAVILFQFARAGHLPTPFPLITWRVDAVVLLVLAFALLPVSLGRWFPDRTDSMVLVLVYAGYLAAKILLTAGVFT